jgi:putative ABC transport system substrate-binding protein
MSRRAFMALIGVAAAAAALLCCPLPARAQHSALPVIGFLNTTSPDKNVDRLRAFRQGLKETGLVEGENVAIEYRWAEGQNDRLPDLAADLMRRRVAVIATPGTTPSALAAKATTATIPIVFAVSEDPVRLGLVASLARPGGNLTGINFFNAELIAKRVELLRELVPTARRVAVLVNPADAASTQATLREVEAAGRAFGLQIDVHNAGSRDAIDAAFAALVRDRADAVFIAGDAFLNSRRLQLALLAARHAVPASYGSRDYPEYGGLMSYGTNVTEAFRQAGVYTGRILRGAKPADLPVMQATKFELVINAQAARVLGLTVPDKLLVAADEVIE